MCLIGAGRAVAGTWRAEALPGPRGGALAAVSCSHGCIAIGSLPRTDAGSAALLRGPLRSELDGCGPPPPSSARFVERESSAGWSTQLTFRLPRPPTSGDPNLCPDQSTINDLSCTSPSACMAVGSVNWFSLLDETFFQSAFAERWNGRKWSVSLAPAGDQEGGLSGVSCTSREACVAVGGVGLKPDCPGNPGNDCSFQEDFWRWNGRRWSIQPFPQRPLHGIGPGGYPTAVSCPSASACVAVRGTVAEHWDGARWSAHRIAASAHFLVFFDSVSCVSAKFCTAVGYAGPPTNVPAEAVAEHWDGKRWTIQPTPQVSDGQGSQLTHVSCPSRHFCVALGSAVGSPLLVEVWNGRAWSLSPVPTPPGSNQTNLSAVSCQPGPVCTAVGGFVDPAGDTLPWVARYS